MIQIKIDNSQIRELAARLEGFSAAKRAKALGRGLAKVAKQGAVAAKREITNEYAIKSGDVAKRLSVRQTSQLRAEIAAKPNSRNRTPLLDFSAKATKKKGVTFRVKKGGGRGRLKHAFIAKMPSGKTGVFQRVVGSRKIKEVVSIDMPHMFAGKRVRPAVVKKINEAFPKTVAHELEFELQRLGFK